MSNFIKKMSVIFLFAGYVFKLHATPGVTAAEISSIQIQSDGNIVGAGFVQLNDLIQFSIARYNNFGIPDVTYGNSGYVATPLSTAQSEINGLSLLSNNEAFVGGFAEVPQTSFAVALYNTNGSPDTSFNSTGNNIYLVGAGSQTNGVAIQSNGQYLAAGVAVVSGSPVTVIIRYNTDGTLDSSFGSGGVVTIQIGQESIGRAIAIQSDGQILVSGFAVDTSDNPCFTVARFNSTDGSLDTTFNSSGVQPGAVLTPAGNNGAFALAIQSNGQIVIAGGNGSNGLTLIRYNSDGSIDTAFGSSGIVNTTIGGASFAQVNGLVIQSDGNIVAAGFADSSFVIARYSATNGSLDTSFNNSGSQPGVVVDSSGLGTNANCVVLNTSGQIIIGGYVSTNALLARYNTNGTLDTTFGTDGFTAFPNSSSVADITGLTSVNLASNAGILYSQLDLTNSIVNSDINTSAAIQDTKLATIQTPGKVLNSATTADSANTSGAIVARDSLGNFSANIITADLVGDVTGSASNNVLKAGDTMTGSLVLPAGSAANPSLQFTGNTNVGLSATSNVLTLSTNGIGAVSIDANGAVTIATPGASEVGLTVNGGGAAIAGDASFANNLSFNTSATTLNAVGSIQGPLVKIYTGTDNTGILGSVTINYTAAGFSNPPLIYTTSTSGIVALLGVNSVTATSASILSGAVLSVPFSYLAIGI